MKLWLENQQQRMPPFDVNDGDRIELSDEKGIAIVIDTRPGLLPKFAANAFDFIPRKLPREWRNPDWANPPLFIKVRDEPPKHWQYLPLLYAGDSFVLRVGGEEYFRITTRTPPLPEYVSGAFVFDWDNSSPS